MTAQKTQFIRLLDVFVFGPLMIASGIQQRSQYFRAAMILIGTGTILYNGANYLKNVQREKEADTNATAAMLSGLGQRAAPHPGRRQYRRRVLH